MMVPIPHLASPPLAWHQNPQLSVCYWLPLTSSKSHEIENAAQHELIIIFIVPNMLQM